MDLDCRDVNQFKSYDKTCNGIGRPARILTPFPTYNISLYELKQFQFSCYVLIKECASESKTLIRWFKRFSINDFYFYAPQCLMWHCWKNVIFIDLFFNWCIVNLQWRCVSFCCAAKWFSYTYTYILFYIHSHYGLSQGTEYSFLCYTAGPCSLSRM